MTADSVPVREDGRPAPPPEPTARVRLRFEPSGVMSIKAMVRGYR